MIILFKMSGEGWEKEFRTKADCTAELLKHICSKCLRGEDGVEGHTPPPDPSDIEALLLTRCGAEYWIEEFPDA